MKYFFKSLIFTLSILQAQAQQGHFIYLQTESKQPFYVKFNSKILSSYPSGYLIIPKLDDGLYSIIIGFPQSTFEQEFNCSINKKDIGFIIKNSGQRQLNLLNVQTLNVVVPADVILKPAIVYDTQTDPFSVMLANAVNDSTILRKDIVKEVIADKSNDPLIKDTINTLPTKGDVALSKPEVILDLKKQDTSQVIASNVDNSLLVKDNVLLPDSSKNNVTAISQPENINDQKDSNAIKSEILVSNDVTLSSAKKKKKSKKDTNALKVVTVMEEKSNVPEKIPEIADSLKAVNSDSDAIIVKSVIKRKSRKNNKDGLELVYIDDYGESKDTIRILMAVEKKSKKEETKISDTLVSTIEIQDKKSIEINIEKNKNDYKITKAEKDIIKEAKNDIIIKSGMINSDCKNFATDEDFLKVRKKMVAETNDEDMIRAAKKTFKSRCFTTEQIKNLSVLFLKDEGKFNFFESSYPFVSDSENYSSLQSQLTENDYITRFRAMIHK